MTTIRNEVGNKKRHGRNRYKAYVAHTKALSKRLGKKGKKLDNDFLYSYCQEKLSIGWSPEQIHLRLPIEHKEYNISHEAIYQYIYSTYRKKDLRPLLARRRKRRMKKGTRKIQKLEKIQSLPSIDNRPVEVEKRKTMGHFEDDCIVSRESKDRIKTVNERVSGVVFIRKMMNGTIQESNRTVISCLKMIPSTFRKTLTRDRGTENMGYRELEEQLNIECYFAHAYASYERGSNENINGLIRRYFPKKTNFALVSHEEIQRVEYLLNTRPRKRLGGLTPYEVFFNLTGVALGH